jgi:phosphoglycolate phosphatase-like HAD superfamily hydrolase
MTSLLQQAIAEIEKLPAEGQDAIAARILAELADERAWESRFDATTDEQWQRLAERARREIAAGETNPLDDVFPPGVSQP